MTVVTGTAQAVPSLQSNAANASQGVKALINVLD